MTFFIFLSCILHNAFLASAISFTTSPFQSLMHAVLLFINSSIILLAIGFEFFAFINLLVYVGALAVLFLFVIMLIDIPSAHLRAYHRGYSTLATFATPALATLFFASNFFYFFSFTNFHFAGFIPALESLTFVGYAFYLLFPDILILNSLVLTLALFGALVLAHTR
jgi:NADH:ubiquinone oxidoreductase subunit 6 (subunit J)